MTYAAIVGHVVAAAIIAVASPLVAGRSIASIDAGTGAMVGAVVSTYVLLALHFARSEARGYPFGWADTFWRVAASFGAVGLLWVLLDWVDAAIVGGHVSHRIFVAALGIAIMGFLANRALSTRPRATVIVAASLGVVVAVLHGYVAGESAERALRPTVTETYIDTSLYQLRALRFSKFIPDTDTTGGAIEALLTGGYLVASADGDLYHVVADRGHDLRVRRLPLRVPINSSQFRAAAQRMSAKAAGADVDPHFFRVADILLRDTDGALELFAAHHYWDDPGRCHRVRISSVKLSTDRLSPVDVGNAWRTVYESDPCLPLEMGGYRGVRFGGLQIGGHMTLDGPSTLLIALGDQEFDGLNSDHAVSQDAATSYGKMISVNLEDGRAEIVGSGLRNPQGMYQDSGGTIWATDHGPQGGDELNIFRRGGNYGWPIVTYGTEYGTHFWPQNPSQGRHEGFEKPVFAFVPSVGLSALTGITGSLLPLWRGDLLAASLKGHSLYRMRFDDDRIMLVEPIKLGSNLRDVIEGSDGRLVVLTDENDLVFLEPAPGHTGAALLQQCLGCHTVARGEPGNLAPNLRRIVGATVAAADFDYSAALEKAGGTWTEQRLDDFLRNPQEFAPGNAMAFAGIASAEDRSALIRYLATLR